MIAKALILMYGLMLATEAMSTEPEPAKPNCKTAPGVCLKSLEELSTEALRQREYHSTLRILHKVVREDERRTYMLGYQSDALALYSRLDLPSSEPPEYGYPVLVLAPGWIPRKEALNWDFGLNGASTYSGVIDYFVNEGFAVITAGYRGRGTVKGALAQGMDYRDAWGNGSYVSPLFYAIDTLNLVSGLESLDTIKWKLWQPNSNTRPSFNYDRVSLWGHSQGGDVGISVLAVAGHNPNFSQAIFSASLWSGNIPDRFTQADTFGAMASTTQAFMSGDGSWSGSALGKNNELNPDFIFAWPSDWIGTLNTQSPDWTWQAEQWSTASVAEARQIKYNEMYTALNDYVRDMADVSFTMKTSSSGQSFAAHAPAVEAIMPKLGGYNYAQYIQTPLALHISDKDYYSMPAWNHDLAARINRAGGQAKVYIYPGNTHSLKTSKHSWFSPPGTVDGAPVALGRDRKLFTGNGLTD